MLRFRPVRVSFTIGVVMVAVSSLGPRASASPSADPMEQVTAPPPTRGPPPPIIRPGARLGPASLSELGVTRQHDGTYRHVDRAHRFTAQFNPDGTVQFADRWHRTTDGDDQNGACCALPPEGIVGLNPFWGVPFAGLSHWIAKAQGKDPVTHAKAELLERTREFRTRLAVAWHLDNLETRLQELEPELLRVWSDDSLPLAQRRAHLFRRWDECDEHFSIDTSTLPQDAITAVDEARRSTAEQARQRIERFIRRHAPQGSAQGFTAGELGNLNRQRISRERFAPYHPSPESKTSPGAAVDSAAQ